MIKVGTDFSGIGSPEMALKELEIEHEVEFACEIDKYARKSYEAIYGTPKRFYEDITKRDHSEVPQLDLYVAGFPCQAFSIAGKRKGFEETRGTLFFNVAEFIQVNQPKCFILENVKGLLSHDSGRTFETIISILADGGGTVNGQMSIPIYDDGLGYHVYYAVLNTKKLGIPQNRERVFVIGFKDFRKFQFPKDKPLKLKLKDMLEEKVDEKYFLSEKMTKQLLSKNQEDNGFTFKPTNGEGESKCITARCFKMGADDNYIKIKSATSKGYEEAKEGDSINYSVPNSETRRGRVGKGVAQTLDTACNQGVLYLGNTYNVCKFTRKKYYEKILFELQTGVSSFDAEKWFFRISKSIKEEEILRQGMHEGRLQEETKEKEYINKAQQGNSTNIITSFFMLNLSQEERIGCSSHRRESIEQQLRELDKDLQRLSCKDTQREQNLQYRELQQQTQRTWLLRKALSEIQEVWRSFNDKGQSVYKNKKGGLGVSRIRRLTPL